MASDERGGIEHDARLLKPAEVATLLGIGRTKAYELIADGTLPVVRVGSSPRVPHWRLLEWIEKNTSGGRAA